MNDAQSLATDSGSTAPPSVPLLALSSIGDNPDDDPFATSSRSDAPSSITTRDSGLPASDVTDDNGMTWARKASVKQRLSINGIEPAGSQEESGSSSQPLRRRRKSRFVRRSDSVDSVISGKANTTRSILKRSSMADLSSVLGNNNNILNNGAYTDRPPNRRKSLARRVSFKGSGTYTEPPTPADTTGGGSVGGGPGGVGRKRLLSFRSYTPTDDFGNVMGPLDSSRYPGGEPHGGEKSPRGVRKVDGMMSMLRTELMKTHKFKFPDRLVVPTTNNDLELRKEKSAEDIILSSRNMDKPPLQKRLSMPTLSRKNSGQRSSFDSESDEVFVSSFHRRKFTLLSSLEKMGVKLPKRGGKYSNLEADVLKRTAEAQRHGSLTSRTLLRNFDTKTAKKQSVSETSPEKPLDEATRSKLQFIFDTMTKEDAKVAALPGLVGRNRFSVTENEIAGSAANVFKSRLRRRKVFMPTRHKLPPVAEHDGNEDAESPEHQSQSSSADPRRIHNNPQDDVRIRCSFHCGDARRNLLTDRDDLHADKCKNAHAKTDDNNNDMLEASRVGNCDVSDGGGRGFLGHETQLSQLSPASKTLTSAASKRASKKSRVYSKRDRRSADASTAITRENFINSAMAAAERKELSTIRRIRNLNYFPDTKGAAHLNEKPKTASSFRASAAKTARRNVNSAFLSATTTTTSRTTNMNDRRSREIVRTRNSADSGTLNPIAGITGSSPRAAPAISGRGRRSARSSDAASGLTLTDGGCRDGSISEASQCVGDRNCVARLGLGALAGISMAVRNARRRRQRRKKKGSNRFKNLAKFVCLLLRAWRFHSLAVEAILEFHQSVDVTLDTGGKDALLFDITEYKADKEARLSTEAIRILKKRPKERTSDEIHYVQVALWNYKSLAEYPVHIQTMIAERAWFESYGAKRVIVREGHHPMGFYFVLSGSALVSVMDMDKGVAKTIMYYNRGDSFGELAIMNGSRRQSTVISKDSIQLLVLSDTDFIEVFMSGGLKDPDDPFLNSLSCLDGWPKEKLGEHPKKANYSYYKRSAVLVADSHNNDWIIIVKSGSVSLLKKLKHMDAKKIMAKRAAAASQQFTDMLMDEAEKQGHVTHEDRVEAGFQQRQEQIEKMGHLARFYALPQIFVDTNESYNEMKRQHDEFTELHGVSTLHARELAATAMSEHQQISRGVSSVNLDREPTSGTSGFDAKRLSGLIKKGPFMAKAKREDGSASAENTQPTPETRNNTTLSALFGQDTPSSATDLEQKKAKAPPQAMYVNVQTLTKGMVFGLSDLFFDNPSMSLVSNGAECISISKKLFMEHASHAFITRIREDIYPYPTEEDMQENLESQVMWDFHRRQTVGHVVHDILWTRADKNDARLNIPSTLSY